MRKSIAKHTIIGVDFDGTLIDHPQSAWLQGYIYRNRAKKQFWLITFRSHGLEDDIVAHLLDSRIDTRIPLEIAHFQGVRAIPYKLFQHRNMEPAEYWRWKADVCQELGCTLLIEDMEEIREHCLALGIDFLHPDGLNLDS